MPRRDYSVYKQGAVVLLPLLAIGLLGLRACLRISAKEEAREEALQMAEIERKAEHEGEQRVELAAMEAEARRKAAEAPRPAAGPKPQPLATGRAEPDAIAVDGSAVYWLDEGSGDVMKAPKDGGAPVVLASKQALDLPRHAQGIAIDDTSVYWITSGTRENHRTDGAVMKVSKTGGEPTALATGQDRPVAIAVQGSSVFFTTAPEAKKQGEMPPGGEVLKVAKSGGKPALVASGEQPCGLAVDETHVYWVEQAPTVLTINKTPKGGGEATVIAASTGRLGCSIAVDATSVYWINRSDDTVMRAQKNGEGVKAVAFEGGRLSAIFVDRSFVYSLTETTKGALEEAGSVWRAPKDGAAPPIMLAADEPGVNGVAVDGKEVFWTRWSEQHAEGAVVRAPK